MLAMNDLGKKIDDRSAVVGVIGLGYVGLPLMRAFCDAGFRVLGFDVDPAKIEQLHAGRNYLKHLGDDLVSGMVDAGRCDATADFARLAEADAVLVCVPTPLGDHLEPDLSYVENTSETIAKTLRFGQLIVLESTTYPRTTRDVMLPVLEKTGLKCGRDFLLAYAAMPQTPLEKLEKLEQLRALENGYKIAVIETEYKSVGVDVFEDYERVQKILESRDRPD